MRNIPLFIFGLFTLLFLTGFGSGRYSFFYHGDTEARSSTRTGWTLPTTECNEPDWGFFAHRRINRLAALTLPPEMMVFFKPNIDWISDHAVDPDMRRYATSFEGPRHYIDLDEYGLPPFENLPRTFMPALQQHTEIWALLPNGDSVLLHGGEGALACEPVIPWGHYFSQYILPRFGGTDNSLNVDTLRAMFDRAGFGARPWQSAFFNDKLSQHGILPWHLQRMQSSLTAAFRARDSKRILRLCADMGHYIGDAHVPLHTTSNYNGQKTGQVGIHGFWESRIPELFADEQYDYFVGKPNYITQPTDYFWGIVLTSHGMVDSVLDIERQLRKTFPQDRQMCPDMRNGRVIIAPCQDFAEAYQQALQGMVERQLRSAIQSVASVWYTAWVDAGQPDLSNLDEPVVTEEELKEEEAIKQKFNLGKILGRPEGE